MKPPKKYGNGGKITPEQYKQAQSDSLILNKAANYSNKNKAYYEYPGAMEALKRLIDLQNANGGKGVQATKGTFFQNIPDEKGNYSGGYNTSFPKPTMIPYAMPKEDVVVEKKPIKINIDANEYKRKPVVIGTAGTYNPNTKKTYAEPSMVNEITPLSYKKGGLVKFIKGYATGGSVNFNEFNNNDSLPKYYDANGNEIDSTGKVIKQATKTSNVGQVSQNGDVIGDALQTSTQAATMAKDFGGDEKTQALSAAGGLAASLAPKIIDKNTQDIYGRYDTGSKGGDYAAGISSGLIKGATKGATAGSALGPQGAAIGAVVGGVGGGIMGGVKTKKDRESIQSDKDAIEEAKKQEKNRLLNERFDFNRNKALEERMAGMKSGGKVMKAPQFKADGGKIEGAGTGKSDSIKAKVKEDSFVVPVENAKVAEQIRKIVLRAPSPKKKANLNQNNGQDVMLSNGEHLFTPKEVEKIERKLGDDVLDKLAPNSAKQEDVLEGENPEMKGGGEVKGGDKEKRKQYLQNQIENLSSSQSSLDKVLLNKYKKELASLSSGKKSNVVKVKKTTIPNNGLSVETMRKLKPDVNNKVVEGERPLVVPKPQQGDGVMDLRQDAVPKADKGSNKSDNSNKIDKLKALGIVGNEAANLATGLTNYIIPAKQTRMGLEFLNKSGARPVDEVDRGFQETVNRANANAKFGYTPEEQAYLNMQNNNLLNAQKNAARNYSGGSSGNAYNMERDASNEAFGRGLEATIAGRKLQMNKQQYADDLNMAKADKMRQLFNDRMQGWQQNQQAGSALLGAGLKNMIGANRYNQELLATQATNNLGTNNLGNSWLNNIGG